MAKIHDPVFIDDEVTMWDDVFLLRDLAVAFEVEAYRRLEPLYGTKVSRFYGCFAAALPRQHGRTVYVILLEHVPGWDLSTVVPPDIAENLCAKHKDAIVDASLRLFFDVLACGVRQVDMQPLNVVLQQQKHEASLASGTLFCDTEECVLAFEVVEFIQLNAGLSNPEEQRARIEEIKPMYLTEWLEGYM